VTDHVDVGFRADPIADQLSRDEQRGQRIHETGDLKPR
jgi:hypothetical protein